MRRKLSNLQFSSVRRILYDSSDAEHRRLVFPIFHQHVCCVSGGLCPHMIRNPQPKARTPGVTFSTKSQGKDQTDPLLQLPALSTQHFQRYLFNSAGTLNGCSSRCRGVRETHNLICPLKRQIIWWVRAPLIHLIHMDAKDKTLGAGVEIPPRGRADMCMGVLFV